MRVYADDETELDATFHVEQAPGELTVRFESRGGTAKSSNRRNREYIPGLELLLHRLKRLGATIDDIVVDSEYVRRAGLSREQRRLRLRDGRRYPLSLALEDTHELRLAVSDAQRSVGRRSGVRPGGGNNTKQIRLYISGVNTTRQALERELAGV